MLKPDYQGGSIVNLMSSIIAARGGKPDYPHLRSLPPDEIAPATNILLLVVDGLGARWLARRSPDGVLSRHLRATITSVFPPTTASAITTYLTGDAPQQHALTGWYTYLRELGCVMTILPGNPRYGGVSYRRAGIDPARLFGRPPVPRRIETPAHTVSPAYIARSDFNLAHLGSARLHAFDSLSDMFRQTVRILRSGKEPSYLYLYWPKLDTIGHERGMESPAAAAHLREIERAVTDFTVRIAGTDTVILICADHGHLDTRTSDLIDLADHPDLADCLALPLCGEPRAAFCYLRPDRVRRFEHYCAEVLADKLTLHRSVDLLDAGLFGLSEPHARLSERIGDYTLLMRERFVIRDSLPSESHHPQIGVHGGLSEEELLVPLCVLRA